VDAVRTADAERVLELERPARADPAKAADVLDDDVLRLRHLVAQRRVAEVARGHPIVDPLGGLADVLGHVREERDHVVVRLALDLLDPLHFERGAIADQSDVLGGNHTQLRLGLARQDLDVLPDLELVLERPDQTHLGPGVSLDHGVPLRWRVDVTCPLSQRGVRRHLARLETATYAVV
jgi:hypothetical protein